MFIKGTDGNDTLSGTQSQDIFNLTQGGNDKAHGEGGHDMFRMGDTLTGADSIDGGTGRDAVILDGNYSEETAFHANTLTNVEVLRVKGGNDYTLIENDGNVAAGHRLFVDALSLQSGDSLTFDGSAETDGHFRIRDGRGDDHVSGGAKADNFEIWPGGDDATSGNGGNDVIRAGHELTAADTIDGGAGNDTVIVRGDYGNLTFGESTLTSVENLVLRAGFDYNFTAQANTAGAGTFTVDAATLHTGDTVHFDGSAESQGRFVFDGGFGNDVFQGGASDDFFHGSGGGDTFTGNGGENTYSYTAIADSTSTHYDTIKDADITNDTFLTPTAIQGFIGGVYGLQGSTLNAATFDSDLTTLVGSNLTAFHADLFQADAGDLSSHVFMVIDQNGVTGYQANEDIVIDVTGFTGLEN